MPRGTLGRLTDALAHASVVAKQHAVTLFGRAAPVEPATQIAAGGGLRGAGTMAIAAVTCIAAGGGAAYCAVEGVPRPVEEAVGLERDHPARAAERSPGARPSHAPPPSTSPAPDIDDSVSAAGVDVARDPPAEEPAPPPRPERTEFDFERGSAPVERTRPQRQNDFTGTPDGEAGSSPDEGSAGEFSP